MAMSREDLIASDEIEESEPSVSHDLNCPLCLKVFRSPRRLPCLHTFCQDCLQSHISKLASVQGTVKQLFCPICRNVACSGEFSKDKLVHVFPLNILMLSVLMKSRSKVKADLVCNVCQTEGVVSPAEDICTICEEALCGQCSKVHRSSRLLTSHTVLKIEDLPSRQETVLQNNVSFHCAEHASFPVEYYCRSHETQLCARCFIASHKRCSDVIELNNETQISDGLSQIQEEMKKIEDQLKRFTTINVSNLSKLESEVNDLIIEIRTLKKTINDALDDLEKRVKEEGNRILDEERNRIEQFNHDCQSHITAIRNSNVTVELASKYATQNQMFLLQKKITNQFSMAIRHIDDKYSKNDILKLQLEVSPQIKAITKIPRGEIGTLWAKKNDEIPFITDGFKPLKECIAKLVIDKEIKGLMNNIPWYTKVAFSAKNELLLVDVDNIMFYFLDPSHNIVCSHTFPGRPFDVCIVSEDGENVVAVTLPSGKLVQFFSLNNKSITYVKQIQTRHNCYGIAAYNHDELVVSGPCGDSKKYYWSLITLDGKEKSYHEFDCKGNSQTYVALNAFKTRLYISVYRDNSLHCFGLDGMKHFTFTHPNLKGPQGVSADRDGNVYVVACSSHNIFQLTPDGFLIKIIVNGIEKKPTGISFDQNGDTFALSHSKDTELGFYNLVDKDC